MPPRARSSATPPAAPSAPSPPASSTGAVGADVEIDEVEQLLDGLTDHQHRIIYQRWSEDDGAWEYLERQTIPTVRQQGVREYAAQRFGGGKYKAAIRATSGTYGPSRTFRVVGPPREFTAGQAPSSTALAAGDRRTHASELEGGRGELGDGFSLDALIKRRMMEEFLAPRPKLGIVEVTAIITALTPVVLAFVKRDSDPMEVGTKIAEMISTRSGPKSDIGEIMEAVNQVLELKERIGGGAPAGDPLGEGVKQLLPHVIDAFASAKRNDANAARSAPVTRIPPRALPAPTDPTLTPPAAPPSDVPVDETHMPTDTPAWALELAPYIQQLVRIAESGRDPRGFAVSLHDYWLPARVKGLLREIVAQDDAEAQLLAHFPELAPFASWTAEFIDECRLLFNIGDPGEDDAPGADDVPNSTLEA